LPDFLKHWLSNPAVGKFVASLVVVVVIVILVRLLKNYAFRFIKDSNRRYRARKMLVLVGYLAGIIAVISILSSKLSDMTVAFGVAGAGIAFALQEVIASVAGWLAISAGNFYKPGDRIQLGGIMGDVIDIGVLRTTLMECRQWVKADQYNGCIVRVANSYVFKEPVFNYSGDFHFLWDEISVPVAYGSDYRLAREIFQGAVQEIAGPFILPAKKAWREMVNKYLVEDARIDPAIFMTANDNWVEFSIRYVVDYDKRRLTKDRLFTRILEDIDKAEGRISIASTTLQLVEKPAPKDRHAEGELKRETSSDKVSKDE
jgi:small-conductance mechanosensitive channel